MTRIIALTIISNITQAKQTIRLNRRWDEMGWMKSVKRKLGSSVYAGMLKKRGRFLFDRVIVSVVKGRWVECSVGWRWRVRMWYDQSVFPSPRRLHDKLRLRLDVGQGRPSCQLRNVGDCVVNQLLGRVRVVTRPDNGKHRAKLQTLLTVVFSNRRFLKPRHYGALQTSY